jgi:hypothetical protein
MDSIGHLTLVIGGALIYVWNHSYPMPQSWEPWYNVSVIGSMLITAMAVIMFLFGLLGVIW